MDTAPAHDSLRMTTIVVGIHLLNVTESSKGVIIIKILDDQAELSL